MAVDHQQIDFAESSTLILNSLILQDTPFSKVRGQEHAPDHAWEHCATHPSQ